MAMTDRERKLYEMIVRELDTLFRSKRDGFFDYQSYDWGLFDGMSHVKNYLLKITDSEDYEDGLK